MLKEYYKSLNFSSKRSFNASMNDAMEDFIKQDIFSMEKYHNHELFLSDIYFHWLKFSADNMYKWCKDDSSFLLYEEDFFEETKITLYICFCKQKLKSERKKEKKKKESY